MEQDADNEIEPPPRKKRAATAAGTVELASHTPQAPQRTSNNLAKTPKRKERPPRRHSTRTGEFLMTCVVIIT
jgi:hypothetical protein